MSDIKYSDAAIAQIVTFGTGSTSAGGLITSVARFYLMKGIIPDQVEFDAAGANFRSADRLVTFSGLQSFTSASGNVITLDITTANAIASGTATWFYWDADPTATTTEKATRYTGSVSANGGGGDLTMADNIITNGDLIGIGQINLTLPQTYTY